MNHFKKILISLLWKIKKKIQIICQKKLLKKKSKILRIAFKILFEIRTFKNKVYHVSNT